MLATKQHHAAKKAWKTRRKNQSVLMIDEFAAQLLSGRLDECPDELRVVKNEINLILRHKTTGTNNGT